MSDETTVEQIVRIIRKRHNEWMIGLMVSEDQWTAQLAREIAALHAEAAAEIERLRMAEVERDAAEARAGRLDSRIATLEAALRFAQEVLEQAMNYIRDETPEVGTVEEARDDTLWKIRDADRAAAAALADARIVKLEAALHPPLSGAKLADVLGRILERNAGGKPRFSGYNELCRALAEYRASAAALADAPE